jgi:hypothetical protein
MLDCRNRGRVFVSPDDERLALEISQLVSARVSTLIYSEYQIEIAALTASRRSRTCSIVRREQGNRDVSPGLSSVSV